MLCVFFLCFRDVLNVPSRHLHRPSRENDDGDMIELLDNDVTNDVDAQVISSSPEEPSHLVHRTGEPISSPKFDLTLGII
jgi:hypothetical protein